MSPIYVIVVMLFLNGQPADDPVVFFGDEQHQITEQSCPHHAELIVENLRKNATPDYQLVAKCIDLAQAPLATSSFGSKAK